VSAKKLREFRSDVEAALSPVGFQPFKHGAFLHADSVWTIVEVGKKWGRDCVIEVGFWLDGLTDPVGEQPPAQHHRCHLYLSLESLFPQWESTILAAGMPEDPGQPAEHDRLMRLLTGESGPLLRALGTETGLRAAMAAGRLDDGMVLKEARAFLTTPVSA
jgi:hypothetical protein